jgi:hypothetical protein
MCYLIRNMKIIIISDTHCGHSHGLTPPNWQQTELQEKTWAWYADQIKRAGPFDFCLHVGDAIDGDGRINSGVEQITTNRHDQVRMAEEALELIGAKQYGFILGSPYHTGKSEDWERVLSDNMDGVFCSVHQQLELDGVVFDAKHVTGGTSIPHGKATAINKESLWATLKAERGLGVKPDVLVRAHTHKFHYTGDTDGLRMTLPAMQVSSLYGAKNFSGITDYGFVTFETLGGGDYSWQPHILKVVQESKVWRHE